MQPSTAGEACRGSSAVGPIAFGQLGPGEDLSGRLVTEVRRLADEAATESDADVLVIDGPPGVGCPLISAITSTDLLVAVAEPSVSGVHDLGRLADLADQVRVPVVVILNKADLSEDGASGIRALCESRELRLIAEVPFDKAGADYLATLADHEAEPPADQTRFTQQLSCAWRSIEEVLGLEARVTKER
jgi:MinD superfamily P-loop ATPase